MTVLILGTPDSGKSLKAENLMQKLSGSDEKIYLATMIPFGEEGEKRVMKHRKEREGKGYITIERPTGLSGVLPEIRNAKDMSCLLECLSNLTGNEIHSDSNKDLSDDDLTELIIKELTCLRKGFRDLVIVSNKFPLEDASYDEDTERYVQIMESVNKRTAELADEVYELIEGGWIKR